MALDEAILEATTEKKSLPTLRLYSWSPPCLSLGHAQPISQIDLDRLQAFKWDIVRRPTGGRAILHADELTYSIAAALDNPHLAGGVLESYKHISQGLVRALRQLNVEIEIQPEVKLSTDEREQAICFELPSSYEITAKGKKLIGSAQVRRRGGVLQHGSLPLGGDLTRICLVLSYPDEEQRTMAASRLQDRATTLEELLGFTIPWQDAADAMVAGFTEALQIHLEPQNLSKEELARADRLCRDKYERQDWVEKH
jgi:lipoate-protein ligase A